jgi:antitoxin (DNA-binding transcriptional repressor) of toxin-antitoxin stability system
VKIGASQIRELTMVADHSTILSRPNVEEIAISKFKATCLSVLEAVRKTGKTVLVTRFGEPMAEVVPPRKPSKPKRWLGCRAGTGQIIGDIVSPASAEADWDALGG